MNILICTIYDNRNVTATAVINSFKAIGHTVITCGPHGENYDGECLSKHDIPLYDKKQKPEYWSYQEILAKVKERYGDIKLDFILQIEPNFHFCGERPKDIPCFYWAIDFHRGGTSLIEAAFKGQFDHIFLALEWAIPYFLHAGFESEQLTWLPLAFDLTQYPPMRGKNLYENGLIQTDIVFLGTPGLYIERYAEWQYDSELGVRYCSKFKDGVKEGLNKYIGYDNLSFEYAERAEYLIRLSQDFDLRIYDRCEPSTYWRVLQRGKIGFNRSLRYDLSPKIFEIPAAGLLLCTDTQPQLGNLLKGHFYLGYTDHFQPQFHNFTLDYNRLWQRLKETLLMWDDKNNQWGFQDQVDAFRDHVLENHSYINRVDKIIEVWEKYYAK